MLIGNKADLAHRRAVSTGAPQGQRAQRHLQRQRPSCIPWIGLLLGRRSSLFACHPRALTPPARPPAHLPDCRGGRAVCQGAWAHLPGDQRQDGDERGGGVCGHGARHPRQDPERELRGLGRRLGARQEATVGLCWLLAAPCRMTVAPALLRPRRVPSMSPTRAMASRWATAQAVALRRAPCGRARRRQLHAAPAAREAALCVALTASCVCTLLLSAPLNLSWFLLLLLLLRVMRVTFF